MITEMLYRIRLWLNQPALDEIQRLREQVMFMESTTRRLEGEVKHMKEAMVERFNREVLRELLTKEKRKR